ncbi:c-type cytochrome [Altererythrobacter xixiisoli]|uniref:C-type cytochrome n=1 Tax=Croceibacterium xixiisoli TaxID=1476466 RepID=A0A6I4TZZ1_9SPHN|nr:cytochrome c peroxidase [Croceibacterium xixiisoli]MXP00642.1 c-type cytochrome [Croceibacterium xixiisoli]
MNRASLILIALAAGVVATAAARPAAPQPSAWQWDLPEGIAPPPVPADNPMSQAKVDLGRRLFYDADLSIDGTMACSNCHNQRRGFADSTRTRPGVHGDAGRRNVQGLANVSYLSPLTWGDTRLTTLEQQAMVPVFGDDPVEMGMLGQDAELARRLSADGCYRAMFLAAFPETGGRVDTPAVAKALAAFQRTLLSFDSPVDRRQRGDAGALTAEAKRGEALFGAHCASCHAGQDFTDRQFHALEDPAAAMTDTGLAHATGQASDRGRYRTPSLRNVALTGPYWHDGSVESMGEAIARHARVLPGNVLTQERERQDIIAFLHGLTDQRFATDPRFAYPDGICLAYRAD